MSENEQRQLGEMHATLKVLVDDVREIKRDVRSILDGKAAVCERHDKEIAGIKRAVLWVVLTIGGAGAGVAKWISTIIP